MSTKENPSPFDPYKKLLPNEPYFLIRAKDPDFEMNVRRWAGDRTLRINMNAWPDTQKERSKVSSALELARAGKEWLDEYRRQEDNKKHPLDEEGYKTSGEHKRTATGNTGRALGNKVAATSKIKGKPVSVKAALRKAGIKPKTKKELAKFASSRATK